MIAGRSTFATTRTILSDSTRDELAREVAALPTLPAQRIGRKTRLTNRKHTRTVRIGKSKCPVFLKSYSLRQCERSLDRAEYSVLEVLRSHQSDLPFLVPEPICYLLHRHVLATTVVLGKPMHLMLLLYGLTRIREGKLLEWSCKLGHGLAALQRLSARLDLSGFARKEIDRVAVEQKVGTIPLFVETGIDKLVAEKGVLLDLTPQRLAHGDLSAQNILVYGDTLGIVDWGCASIRSVFHDPLHLARCIVFSQRRGVPHRIAIRMATELLTTYLQAADLPCSAKESATMLKLELCRSLCADGVADRILKKEAKFTEQFTALICGLKF